MLHRSNYPETQTNTRTSKTRTTRDEKKHGESKQQMQHTYEDKKWTKGDLLKADQLTGFRAKLVPTAVIIAQVRTAKMYVTRRALLRLTAGRLHYSGTRCQLQRAIKVHEIGFPNTCVRADSTTNFVPQQRTKNVLRDIPTNGPTNCMAFRHER